MEKCTICERETKESDLWQSGGGVMVCPHCRKPQTKKSEKKFKAYWGVGYHNRGSKIVKQEFISNDNGYSIESQNVINVLQVGQSVDLTDPVNGAYHSIKRIK